MVLKTKQVKEFLNKCVFFRHVILKNLLLQVKVLSFYLVTVLFQVALHSLFQLNHQVVNNIH